jgi:hypothetical protein
MVEEQGKQDTSMKQAANKAHCFYVVWSVMLPKEYMHLL